MEQRLRELSSTAATWIAKAKGIIILAGAGMGVDSGLPDFRGDKGFWKAYPMYEQLGIGFVEAANPQHFEADPAFGWGFYGHRLGLYRQTSPHQGYQLILDWSKRLGLPYFVVTSNVDGHFQKAGFDEKRVLEVHGSIHHLQCSLPCGSYIWNNQHNIAVDVKRMRALEVPFCKTCGKTARPNILMFADWNWVSERSDAQQIRYKNFISEIGHEKLVALELGAGLAVPTIRMMTERLSRQGVKAVRINPKDPAIARPNLSIAHGGKEALEAIDRALSL